MKTWRRVLICGPVAMVLGCTRLVGGAALPPVTPPLPDSAVDVAKIMLDTPRMRALVGADEQLTIIPTMDSSAPVDIDELAASVPPPCHFLFDETAVFGSALTRFRKTTYQYPPRAALISEGAAVYPDADSARRTLEALAANVAECADSSAGPELVSDWVTDDESLQTQAGACGRSYQVKSVVLLEVTYCGFSASEANLVVANMAAGVPG